jgi:hypothetical protein
VPRALGGSAGGDKPIVLPPLSYSCLRFELGVER